MTNILKTEYEILDKYLSKFANKKIYCLDIGSSTGEFTCWMLNNLCNNPYSKVYSIDTWDTNTEYDNYTNNIEKIFDENVEKTGKQNHHMKMKMDISKALFNLKDSGIIIFDIIIINPSHIQKDILTSAILSWEILNENGILIFDDYKYDKLIKEKNIAIDSFINVYKLQIKIKYTGNQTIIKKINKVSTNKELEKYYEIVDSINYFKFEDFEVVFDEEVDENFEFKLKEDKSTSSNLLQNINKDIDNYELLNNIFISESSGSFLKIIPKYKDLYNYTTLLCDEMSIKFDKINDKIISKYLLLNYLYTSNSNDKIFIIDYKLNSNGFNNIYSFINKNHKLSVTINNILIDNIGIYNKIINNNKQYDLIYFSLTEFNINKLNNTHRFIYIIYYIGILLNIQQKNGNTIMVVPYWINKKLLYQCIYFLKKYYKKIILKNKYQSNFGAHYYIICYDYYNINKNDIKNLNEMIKYIYDNNIYNIDEFLSIKNTNIYNNFLTKIDNTINILYRNINNLLKLYNNIYIYISNNSNKLYNNNLKMLCIKLLITNLIYLFKKNKKF